MTQQLEHPAASTVVNTTTSDPAELPELWVLCVAKASISHNITEIFSYLGLPRERTVLVSDIQLPYMTPWAHNQIIGWAQRDSDLWNAGLNRIHHFHRPHEQWDVLLLNPAAPVSQRSVHSLRHHMRATDTWMAEPDVFDTLQDRRYVTTFQVDPGEVHPQTVVIAGERGVRFDHKFYDDSDSWVEYCRRTRALGGSVRVGAKSLRELVL